MGACTAEDEEDGAKGSEGELHSKITKRRPSLSWPRASQSRSRGAIGRADATAGRRRTPRRKVAAADASSESESSERAEVQRGDGREQGVEGQRERQRWPRKPTNLPPGWRAALHEGEWYYYHKVPVLPFCEAARTTYQRLRERGTLGGRISCAARHNTRTRANCVDVLQVTRQAQWERPLR